MDDESGKTAPSGNGGPPATQHDLAIWGGQLTERSDELAAIMERFGKSQETMRRVLDRIDERLNEQADHTERIERLEQVVLGAGDSK